MERDSIRKDQILIGITVVAFLFLTLLAIFSYSGKSESVFGLDNFYQGNQGEMPNPKDQYAALHNTTIANSNSCLTEMTVASNPQLCGKSYLWFIDGESVASWKALKKLTTDSTYSTIKPFTKTGTNIIAPSELKFVNSNVVQYDKNSISIIATISDNYMLEFNDVKSWWCHIGKSKQNRHTIIVGNGGVNPICAEGYIIGEAKESTTVTLYKVDESGSKEPCSFKDLFFSN